MKYLVIVLFVGVAFAAPSENKREKRQVLPNCVDSYQNVADPCRRNTNNRVYYPHPRDQTKFLQCDVFGRMFVVQCPAGEIYNQATTTCIKPQTTTLQTTNTGMQNPCTAANINNGKIYFSVATDSHQFIECDLNGNANVLTCPSQLLWDENRLSCVYQFQSGVLVTTPNPNGGLGGVANPCRGSSTSRQFFSHPDATKFIQCDIAGNAFVLTCPSGLVWNQFSTTCVSPFTMVAGG
ncbi:uncharacterized protein LOC127698375 [Mytilus californianus]|uniref:uncharacterized protein LOC127698375 n=1 Tax=Mytilus californianus TaxID=6549 RepID=UPI0022459CF3|nr:uncharacterized protein LOC127698375 [Mytilus californianus]